MKNEKIIERLNKDFPELEFSIVDKKELYVNNKICMCSWETTASIEDSLTEKVQASVEDSFYFAIVRTINSYLKEAVVKS
jgi:hypothetical protein